MRRILGIDPGLRNFGWACLRGEDLVSCGVITTAPMRGERKSGANVRRTIDLAHQICAQLPTPSAVAIEEQCWVRSAAASIQIAHSWGVVLALLVSRWHCQVHQVPPRLLKNLACGGAAKEKSDVVAAAELRWPGALQHIPRALRQHAADAAWCAEALRLGEVG